MFHDLVERLAGAWPIDASPRGPEHSSYSRHGDAVFQVFRVVNCRHGPVSRLRYWQLNPRQPFGGLEIPTSWGVGFGDIRDLHTARRALHSAFAEWRRA